ncbi:MAG: hypothetical protein OXN21_15335 [Chloroflexota bacterium]|nr:hypothetical protein [Chloroflexota bacterium]
MYEIAWLQLLAYVLIICGFLLMFIFRRDLLLNAHTPTTGKTLGYVGALLLLAGLLTELVIYLYNVSNLAG